MQDDGKSASRFGTKPSGGLCAVLPYDITGNISGTLKQLRRQVFLRHFRTAEW